MVLTVARVRFPTCIRQSGICLSYVRLLLTSVLVVTLRYNGGSICASRRCFDVVLALVLLIGANVP